LVATISGILTIIGGRKKAKADVQSSLNAGFEILVRELQKERTELMQIIKRQAETVEKFEQERRELHAAIARMQRRPKG
jgi:hypothetical protein